MWQRQRSSGFQHLVDDLDAAIVASDLFVDLLGRPLVEAFFSQRYQALVGPTQKAHEQKIVEVAGLKRSVLPIVREPQQLALRLWNTARWLVHPLESTGHKKRRRGAPPFPGQAGQPAALAHPLIRFILSAEAECELSGDEPELSATSAMAAIWCRHIGDGRALLAIGSKPLDAVALFQPALGIAAQVAVECEIGIIGRNRTEISRHIYIVFGFQRCIVDVAGEKLDVTVFLVSGDNLVFVSAVPAEACWVKPVPWSIGIPARQLALEPCLARLRRNRRPLLRSLERTLGPAVEDYIDRPAHLGSWVLINRRWYETVFEGAAGLSSRAAVNVTVPSRRIGGVFPALAGKAVAPRSVGRGRPQVD